MFRFTSYLFVVLVLCGFLATVARAEDGQSDLQSAIDVVIKETYVSKDVRYFGALLRDKPALRTDIVISERQTGWHLGIWRSIGLGAHGTSSPSNEVNFTVGKKVNDWLTADCIYMNNRPFHDDQGDVLDFRLKASHSFNFNGYGQLMPYIQAECRLGLPDFIRRPTATLGTDYAIKIIGPVSLTTGVSAFFDYGSPTADRGLLFRGQLGLAWKPTANTALSIGIEAYEPYQLRDRQDQKAITASFSLHF